MNQAVDATTQDVIHGALKAWGVLGVSAFLRAGERAGAVDIHDGRDRVIATVRRDVSPIGWVWHVGLGERRERVLPSVVTALRYLRGHLCPERQTGRVLFGQGEG
ncbi:hypothetical protein C2W62_29790 [Candidatus Entotheonella serta]|nr:hypothetical protein C2W62_29790 [Candidatus Entotheonella serta]